MKRTIEITDDAPDLSDLDYSGDVHSLIDGTVPVYAKEVDDLFYLYGSEIEGAFENAGIGDKNDDGWPSGWRPAAIYCWLEEYAAEWYRANADDITAAWHERHQTAPQEA